MLLDRCDGPECPMCGCRDATILREPADPSDPDGWIAHLEQNVAPGSYKPEKWRSGLWWQTGRARCNHCGLEHSYRPDPPHEGDEEELDDELDDEPPVPRPASTPASETTCPACGGSRYWVYKTRTLDNGSNVRYRKCKDCQHRGDGNKSLR